jgi:D-tagatose-1,6-bisphosphate aldolase subunit GatZ/KbaZ
MMQAQRDESLLLIESTSNQVNQFGGCTGKTPAEFALFIRQVASAMDFPNEKIVLGGGSPGTARLAQRRQFVCDVQS